MGISPIGDKGAKMKCPGYARNSSAPPSLCDGDTLRGTCHARHMRVCGGPVLMGGLMVRCGCIRVFSVVADFAGWASTKRFLLLMMAKRRVWA